MGVEHPQPADRGGGGRGPSSTLLILILTVVNWALILCTVGKGWRAVRLRSEEPALATDTDTDTGTEPDHDHRTPVQL